jgi:hypothetical protein
MPASGGGRSSTASAVRGSSPSSRADCPRTSSDRCGDSRILRGSVDG